MGVARDPWFVEASPFHTTSYGAFPQYHFDHQQRGLADDRIYQAPQLTLPEGLGLTQLSGRLQLLDLLKRQSVALERCAEIESFDRYRQSAVSLMTDPKIQKALDVTRADDHTQERYGKNSFGWSLLMARRLVEVRSQSSPSELREQRILGYAWKCFSALERSFAATDRPSPIGAVG